MSSRGAFAFEVGNPCNETRLAPLKKVTRVIGGRNLHWEPAMTLAQKQALRLLIEADRLYRSKVAHGILADADHRGIEIWAHGSIHIATARSLNDAGLAELVDTTINGSKWLFLGRCEPYDDVE